MLRYLFFLLLMPSSLAAQVSVGERLPATASGKCYSKCMTDPVQTIKERTYAVYTGTAEPKRSRVRERTVYTTPPETKWVKRQAPGNCSSPNPADCTVWCLVEIGGDPVTFYEVKNTKKTPEYEMRTIATIEKEVGKIGWHESVCPQDQTEEFLHELQNALVAAGVGENLDSGTLDRATHDALEAFQRREQLPIGGLNRATVEALGLSMPGKDAVPH